MTKNERSKLQKYLYNWLIKACRDDMWLLGEWRTPIDLSKADTFTIEAIRRFNETPSNVSTKLSQSVQKEHWSPQSEPSKS